MAWTNVGFDGTINEAQWSQMAGLLGNGYVAAGNGDCVVTAVPGARSVSVAAGSLYGDGVVSTNSGPETVAMTTPVNGQWYVIALRRTWATNTAALVAIAGATTTTTTPTAPPTSFPTLNTNVGVLTDQPIAWAWCNSANTTVVVYDLRMKPYKQTNPISVSSVNDRDAKFPAPVQGTTVWRDDLGALETFFALYNVSTNPGGRSVAGWQQESTGRVLQVVYAKTTTNVATTASTYVSTSLEATITPKSATSKILVLVNQQWLAQRNSVSIGAQFGLFRDTSEIATNVISLYVNSSGAMDMRSVLPFTYLDSPNTTNALVYKMGFHNQGGGASLQAQSENRQSYIALIEVAA